MFGVFVVVVVVFVIVVVIFLFLLPLVCVAVGGGGGRLVCLVGMFGLLSGVLFLSELFFLYALLRACCLLLPLLFALCACLRHNHQGVIF